MVIYESGPFIVSVNILKHLTLTICLSVCVHEHSRALVCVFTRAHTHTIDLMYITHTRSPVPILLPQFVIDTRTCGRLRWLLWAQFTETNTHEFTPDYFQRRVTPSLAVVSVVNVRWLNRIDGSGCGSFILTSSAHHSKDMIASFINICLK